MTDVATLVQASRLYYELGETQERIAEILGVTRPQVSRLLKEARAEGIVEIRVIDADQGSPALAAELRDRFHLRFAVLAPRLAGPADLTRRMLGRRAAHLLRDHIRAGSLVGVGDGAAMTATADALEELIPPVRATFVPLSGGGFSAPSKDPVRRMAEAFDGQPLELFAPGLVYERHAREALLTHLGNQTVARAWEQLDIAMFGIGSYVRSEAWFGAQLVAEMDDAETVGEILIHPFDLHGRFVSDRLRELVIGFDARDLHRVPLTIGVAGGAEKVRPILGALRTGALSALVTDDETAREVISLDRATGVTATERRRGDRRRSSGRRPADADADTAVASGV
jgi:DNA-binding transcriptional regulator LsrR (DeoR family)